MNGNREFGAFADRKFSAAHAATVAQLRTVIDRSAGFELTPVGGAWCDERFDGPFWTSTAATRPSISIVFVQSYDGNTG